jgi:hypothetical protein
MAHTMVDPTNQKWFARCLGLTLAHRNLQDAARERLSLSALVCGRGMAFGKEYIEKHGWRLALPSESIAGTHPTEDFRHGVRLAEHGYRVAFAPMRTSYTPLRQSLGPPPGRTSAGSGAGSAMRTPTRVNCWPRRFGNDACAS